MSWLKIDDGFEDHPKVANLTNDAHRLWMRAGCWCRKPSNSHTNGFVPRGMLGDIYRNKLPQKRLEKLAQELVEATGGGMFKTGLWEPVDGGWKFHDWKDYQPTEEKPETLSRKESASVAGKRSAEVRRELYGTAQPNNPNDVRERSPNEPRTTFDRTNLERPEPPDPDPDPKILPGRSDPRPDKLPPPVETPPRAPSVGTRRFSESLNTEAPDSIEFTEEHRQVAASQGVDLEQAWLECRDHRRAAGFRSANWGAVFLSWLRRERKFAQSRASPGKKREPPQPNDETNRYRPPIFEP